MLSEVFPALDPFLLYSIEILLFSILGLCLGSFSTALIYRIPREISWIVDRAPKDKSQAKASRSRCPSCGHELSYMDLIPFFSWCFFGGKCRYCKVKISAMYPIVELSTFCVCLSVYFLLGWSLQALFILLALPFLMALVVIDFERYILPDQLNLIFAVLGLGYTASLYIGSLSGVSESFVLERVFAGVIYGFFLWGVGRLLTLILSKDALGFGDVKFFAAAGIWLGFQPLPYFLILAGLFGICIAMIWKYVKGVEIFPFGPSLILSFFVLFLVFN